MRHLEDALQKSCVRWFEHQWAAYTELFFHVPNGGKRNPVEAAKFKAMGVKPGVADLLLLVPNRFYPYMGIELKSEKGRASDHQKKFRDAVERVGGKYVLVRSLDEFMDEVNRYLSDALGPSEIKKILRTAVGIIEPLYPDIAAQIKLTKIWADG